MSSYIPATKSERLEMLKSIGMSSFDELYSDIPESLRYKKELNIPSGLSEMEVAKKIAELASKNTTFKHIFRGAGSYNHYIPAIVTQVTSKEEFVTAYTPYQAEISQGVLQSIFEYQTMICELTGLDASNASVYDGATAAAEAAAMCRDRKHKTVYISATVDPKVRSVVATYAFGSGAKLIIVPERDGVTDPDLPSLEKNDAACLIVQSPNYYGIIEDVTALGQKVHSVGAKLVMSANPISLGLLKTPAECGADIAIGEGQPLGIPMGFGGPYLGFMTATKAMMRKLPGRIVGQTTDVDGKRAYVLTLQAREQHIRREKASSNICSNEALCAMKAAVYLACMGSDGLARCAENCTTNAHYLLCVLEKLGFKRKYEHEFFHEFVAICPCDANDLAAKLAKKGYLSGLPLNEKEMLWCATEMNSADEINSLSGAIAEVLA